MRLPVCLLMLLSIKNECEKPNYLSMAQTHPYLAAFSIKEYPPAFPVMKSGTLPPQQIRVTRARHYSQLIYVLALGSAHGKMQPPLVDLLLILTMFVFRTHIKTLRFCHRAPDEILSQWFYSNRRGFPFALWTFSKNLLRRYRCTGL